MRNLTSILAAIIIGVMASAPALADGGNAERNSRLAPFQKLIEDKKFDAAVGKLRAALREQPEDADLLNLLAFSQRNLERYDEALENYLKALRIDPDHRGANEYLGELYLQLGQLERARERLKVLDEECFFGCDEYDELEEAIENYISKNQS